jgi:hypothetical protein
MGLRFTFLRIAGKNEQSQRPFDEFLAGGDVEGDAEILDVV